MKKKGFTLIELIISISLIAVIATIFTISFINIRKNKLENSKLTPVETEILNAAKVYLSVNSDKDGEKIMEQLALGAQGVKISISELINNGLIDEKTTEELKEIIEEKNGGTPIDNIGSYYVLAINGTFDEKEKERVCDGLNYYLSWREDFDKDQQVYFCGKLPNNSSSLERKVYIKEKNDNKYTSYIYGSYNQCSFTVKDENGAVIEKQNDDTYPLTYAKKYFISYDENCYSWFVDLSKFNGDKVQIYLTLNDIVMEKTPTKTFDLEKYLYYSKPTYKVNYLSNKLPQNAKPAQEILNYNTITPYPISYEKAQKAASSIYINTSSKYCYGTELEVVSDTSIKEKKKFKLGGSISCKKYTPGDTWFEGRYTLRETNENATTSRNTYLLQKELGDTSFSGQEFYFEPTEFDNGYYYDYDDNGTTYFFRGDANNYVSFAGQLWRIVRINGDGSIRLILDDDIGTTNWNDSTQYEYYNAYMYGTIAYYPLISNDLRSKQEDVDLDNKFCYSDGFTYNKTTNKYQLAGDITCEKITKNTKAIAEYKYTLKSTSKTASSTKMYKFGYIDSSFDTNVYTYDTESSSSSEYTSNNSWSSSISPSTVCLGSDYTIEAGQYKLSGNIDCDISLSSNNYSKYKNYYILIGGYNKSWVNDKNITGTKMYKFLDCTNCRSGVWSRYDNYLYRVYQSPEYLYTNNSDNQSKPYELLNSWYSANLSAYDDYITTSTFCNDTSVEGTTAYFAGTYAASNRLTSTSKTPTFKCNKTFKYGGKYYLKIGLITADELAFAGAAYNSANSNYYMAYNKSFWTMTPASKTTMFTSNMYENSESYSGGAYYYDGFGNYNEVDTQEEWDACQSGSLDCKESGGIMHEAINYNIFSSSTLDKSVTQVYSYDGNNGIVVRPVINLRSDTLVYNNGTGTYGNPYVVDTKWDDYEYIMFTGDVG